MGVVTPILRVLLWAFIGTAVASHGLAETNVPLRAGEHPTYSRLVADWPGIVDYEVKTSAEETRIIFKSPGKLLLDRVRKDLPKSVTAVDMQSKDGVTTLIVRHAPLQGIHHFRVKNSVALDLRYLNPANSATENSRPAEKSISRKPEKPAEPKPEETAKDTPSAPAKQALKSKAKAPERSAATGTTTPRPEPQPSKDGQLVIGYETVNAGAELTFPWPKPVAAAVFIRAGHLWVLFNAPADVNIAAVEQDPAYITLAQQIRNNRAVVLRFRLATRMFAHVSRNGAVWKVGLRRQPGEKPGAIAVLSEPYHSSGARVFLSIVDAGKRVLVFDPEVGDELQIIPVLAPDRGLAEMRRYPQFHLLPTRQGIVVKPLVEDLIISSGNEGIALTVKRGLVLSPPDAIASFRRNAKFGSGLKGKLLNLSSWRGNPSEPPLEKKAALVQRYGQSRGRAQNQARWLLARFHFAHGEIAEAVAYTSLLTKSDPDTLDDPKVRAVRGVSHLLMYHFDQAEEDLSHTDLNRYSDIALWRGMLEAHKGRTDAALQQFKTGVNALKELPRNQRGLILKQWAALLAEKRDVSGFKALHQLAKELKIRAKDLAYFELHAGQFAEWDNDHRAAARHYERAVDSNVREVRAYANLRQIEMDLSRGTITPEQAIDRMEGLHFAWRGDAYELNLRKRIAEMSIELADFRKGLTLYRQIAASKPPDADKQDVTARMSETFEKLFLHGAADRLDPVRALALFYDFQELTPYGKTGDQVIRNLADRLVNVELLDQAERLLKHQVDHRLKGGEKARVAADLAYINLLNQQPDEALKTLDRSKWPLIDTALQDDRRHLRARALIDLGRDGEAEALLQTDQSSVGLAIKADLFWKQQKWQAAADQLAALTKDRWQNSTPLSQGDAAQVMKLAVARYLADEKQKLQQIADQYQDLMKPTDYGESFQLLTHSVDPATTDFRKLPAAIASVDGLDAFLSTYKEKFSGSGNQSQSEGG